MTDAQVLVVDDEPGILKTLSRTLQLEGYGVLTASSAAEAEACLRKRAPDLVLMDVKLPDGNGLDILERLGDGGVLPLPAIVISGNASIEDAVRALKLGAETYLEKPPESERLLKSVANALSRRRLEAEVAEWRERAALESGSSQLLGDSAVMKTLRAQVERVAVSEGRVLILGENGTGKELVARAIHAQSERGERALVSINCAAVPAELIESELFGHEKGAFTGASSLKIGKFERAHKGTLFLDEVGDMPADMQAKLLRVLESGEVERVGGDRAIHVDVRVLAATNKDLAEEVEAGRFREDLYYRLNVVPLRTPPLRERRDDIGMLMETFLAEAARQNRRRHPPVLTEAARSRLRSHDFPGNVRELRNLAERILILADPTSATLDASDIEPLMPGRRRGAEPSFRPGTKLSELLEDAERSILAQAMVAHDGVVAAAARSLGMDRSNLSKKLVQLGLR